MQPEPRADPGWLRSKQQLAGIALASLDLARPFFDSMGIAVPEAEPFQTPLRSTIAQHPVAFAILVPRAEDALVVDIALGRIEATCSREHATGFRDWINAVFYAWEDKSLWMYQNTLTAWHAAWRHGGVDSLGLAAGTTLTDAFAPVRHGRHQAEDGDREASLPGTRTNYVGRIHVQPRSVHRRLRSGVRY